MQEDVRQLLDILDAHGEELLNLDVLHAQVLEHTAEVSLRGQWSVSTRENGGV